jgi:hypothetical protein
LKDLPALPSNPTVTQTHLVDHGGSTSSRAAGKGATSFVPASSAASCSLWPVRDNSSNTGSTRVRRHWCSRNVGRRGLQAAHTGNQASAAIRRTIMGAAPPAGRPAPAPPAPAAPAAAPPASLRPATPAPAPAAGRAGPAPAPAAAGSRGLPAWLRRRRGKPAWQCGVCSAAWGAGRGEVTQVPAPRSDTRHRLSPPTPGLRRGAHPPH